LARTEKAPWAQTHKTSNPEVANESCDSMLETGTLNKAYRTTQAIMVLLKSTAMQVEEQLFNRAKRLLSLFVEEHGADLLEALRSLLAPRCEFFRVHQERLQPVIEAIGRHIFCRGGSSLNHNRKSSLRSALRPIPPWSVRQNSDLLKFHRDQAEID